MVILPFGNCNSTNTWFRGESSIDSDVGAWGEVDKDFVFVTPKISEVDRVSH